MPTWTLRSIGWARRCGLSRLARYNVTAEALARETRSYGNPRELLFRSRRGRRVRRAAVSPPLLLDVALLLAALRPCILVARLAGLLRVPCSFAIVPLFIPPVHALCLRVRGTDA